MERTTVQGTRDLRTTGNRNYDIEKVWDSHHEIVRRLVLGEKPVQIANNLGITTQTVSNVRNNPIVKRLFGILHSARDASVVEIRNRIVNIAPLAIEYLETVLNNELSLGTHSATGLGAAKTIIENVLPKSTIVRVDETLTIETINSLKERARQAGMLQAASSCQAGVINNAGVVNKAGVTNQAGIVNPTEIINQTGVVDTTEVTEVNVEESDENFDVIATSVGGVDASDGNGADHEVCS